MDPAEEAQILASRMRRISLSIQKVQGLQPYFEPRMLPLIN
mgnify:CR=1 FL=1